MRQELESKENMIAELLSDVSSITPFFKTLIICGGDNLVELKEKIPNSNFRKYIVGQAIGILE